MGSLFMMLPRPHLCVANQPVGHMELFTLRAVSIAPGRTGFRQMCPSPFWQSPPNSIIPAWAEPPWSQDNPQGTLCRATSVFSQGAEGKESGAGRLLLAPHCVLSDLGSPLPLSGLRCSSRGQGQTGSRKSMKMSRQPRTFWDGDLW